MRQKLVKLALPLDAWRANFLLNVVIAPRYFGREGPFSTQLADKLSIFYYDHIECYPGMDSAELVDKVMKAGLMWFLMFASNFRIVFPPALKFMKTLFDYPIIPRSSLKQFFQKLVLNMLCYQRTPISKMNKLFTRSSQDYLSELLYRWDSSSEFVTPHYHIILDTIRSGQTILMVSPPPREQLTRLWTVYPDVIYQYLGIQYNASTGETIYESVHGLRWEDSKTLLVTHDPTNILLHPSLKHLDWIPSGEMIAAGPPREISETTMDFFHKRYVEESEYLEEESQELEEELQDLEEPQALEEEPQNPAGESQD